ncbi:MAG: AAA family ATPase [Terriglobales bacterium]
MSRSPAKTDPLQRLRVIIDSSTPVVIIETVEELRALRIVKQAAADLNLPVFEWSIADGLARSGATSGTDSGGPPPLPGAGGREATETDRKLAAVNASLIQANLPPLSLVTGKDQFADNAAPPPVYNTKEAAQVLQHLELVNLEGVFVMKDMHRHMESPIVLRLIREVAQAFARDRRTLVLVGPSIHIPGELQNEVEYLHLPMPDRARLKQIIHEEFKRLSQSRKLTNKLDAAGLDAMAGNLCGLTEEEAVRAIGQALIARYGLTQDSILDVLDAKREMLKRSGTLEFVEVGDTLNAIGGLENLKTWLRKRRAAFDEGAKAFGLEPPKGVIILGVQGCGKSMCARAIAGEWKLPLVKFDSSAVFDKYVGETEKRIQKLFRVAEQLAPCVLWIDELEKVFAGSGPDSASSDAGTSSRLLGAFLSWMQDRKAPVFVAATSNNVTVLPPELIRKGRFDELFFVDLPNVVERRAIFEVQLKRRTFNPADSAKFDLVQLVAASNGYSGAEIDAALQSSMYACFADKKSLCTEIILAEIKNTVPLSLTRAEDIGKLRAWAKQRAVPASAPDASQVAASK